MAELKLDNPKPDRRHDNPGRPPISPDGTVRLTVRLTPEQKAKVLARGGNEWLRQLIDKAR